MTTEGMSIYGRIISMLLIVLIVSYFAFVVRNIWWVTKHPQYAKKAGQPFRRAAPLSGLYKVMK